MIEPVAELTRIWRVLTTPELRRTPRVCAFFDFIVEERETLRPITGACFRSSQPRHNPGMSHPDLESRARALVDDKLIRAYWEAVEHYKTRDLVLIYAVGDARYPVRAFAREELLSSTLPADIKSKIADPPSNASGRSTSGDATFWLLAIFSDEEAACLAVNAKLMAPGGRA